MESITKLTDRELVGLLASEGSRLSGTGVSGAAAARLASPAVRVEAMERPKAPVAVVAAAAAAAHADAYVPTSNAAGAGHQIFGQQKTQLHTMWALRGLDPWSDPA